MPFISVSDLKPHGSSNSQVGSTNYLKLSSRVSGKNSHALDIRMGVELADALRFCGDDRVDILFDRDNRKGKLVRVAEGGWKLRQASSRQLVVSVTLFDGMPYMAEVTACGDVTRTPDGCVFEIPDAGNFEAPPRSKSQTGDTERALANEAALTMD